MTDQRDLDRLLVAFFVEGTDELADRVIDSALDQITYTRQRRPLRAPWRLRPMTLPIRLATAAVIGVVAVGGAFYLIQPGKPEAGGLAPTPGVSSSVAPASTPIPARTPRPSPASVMTVGRQIHTATLLPDGHVLVAGGYAFGDSGLASADLYDPATHTFNPTGSLADARGRHTSTLLADGRVLITGGGPASYVVGDAFSFLATAELYDATAGTFSRTGSMATPREVHTATLLSDGRVLITGGIDVIDHALTSAELYDPNTGTFSPTGSMATARSFHTATLLADGRVLIAGGGTGTWGYGGPFIASAEIYDPKTGKFSTTGPMVSGRAWHTATRLSDGRVLITGGSSDTGTDQASAELYDPKTGMFSATGPMTDVRIFHTATLLTDGRVLVAGGGRDYANHVFLQTAELFDPKTATFTATGSLASARTFQAATLLSDGRVLVSGGYGARAPLPSAEIYDPLTGTFSPAGSGG